jgi:hypothetical protein
MGDVVWRGKLSVDGDEEGAIEEVAALRSEDG